MFGVFKGSLLGPMLYAPYTKEIEILAVKHNMTGQIYVNYRI